MQYAGYSALFSKVEELSIQTHPVTAEYVLTNAEIQNVQDIKADVPWSQPSSRGPKNNMFLHESPSPPG